MEKQRMKVEDARPHFFKIIHGEDIKQHLRIPPVFMKHLPQEMPGRATLTGPSGSHCCVTLSMEPNGTYLDKGWKVFMKENNLGDDEFLIFRYHGNMHFYVKIFDNSGVKREAAPVSGTSNGKRGRGRPMKRPVDSLNLHKLKLHGSEERPGQAAPVSGTSNGKRGRGTPMKRPVDSLNLHKLKLHGSEERPGQIARPFTSQHPHFRVDMIKSNVDKCFLMRIPQSFSDAGHFPPSKSKTVLRDSAGKTWDVICLYDKGHHYLSGGWRLFVRDNNLKLGDVCIFELVSKDEMKVHVL